MFVICEDQTIDLTKYNKIRYRESLLGNGYPVEAEKTVSGGLFGSTSYTDEIVRMKYEEGARNIAKAITIAWANGDNTFDVCRWLEENNNEGEAK